MLGLAKVPSPDEADHGTILEEEQLSALVQGFKGSALFPIVAVAAYTGARRNEILALRWSDLDEAKRTYGSNVPPSKRTNTACEPRGQSRIRTSAPSP